ncbi:hypothetical protein [Spongiibacter sp. UBA1325]|jgi:hypothetical protein|uniref:hypothetical protein n=1 Tax=Spongiibacter sp. UBA1325 TaxID=1947543 RepID=UPI00257E6EF5|nr:hypothetical protein [Spongiibacter sp. UBA1325]|tara:strand:- start:13496 stop:13675 length:180 start_codon:yes stop_codon:yes gene_type:complete
MVNNRGVPAVGDGDHLAYLALPHLVGRAELPMRIRASESLCTFRAAEIIAALSPLIKKI